MLSVRCTPKNKTVQAWHFNVVPTQKITYCVSKCPVFQGAEELERTRSGARCRQSGAALCLPLDLVTAGLRLACFLDLRFFLIFSTLLCCPRRARPPPGG